MTRYPARTSRLPTGVAAALAAASFATALTAATSGTPVVLFDEGHGQLFHVKGTGPLDLSRFAKLVTDRGGEVRVAKQPLTGQLLSGSSALVLSGAFRPLAAAETDAVVAWVEKGGQLCVMIHVEPPQAALLHRFGVSVSTRPIREVQSIIGGDPLNYAVTRLRPSPLMRSLASFNVYGAWALLPTGKNAEPVAETSPQAWVDLNGNGTPDLSDARQAFAVAVSGSYGKGRFFVLGDDAALQNQFLSGGNLKLGGNLASWLLRRDGQPAPPPGLVRSHDT